MSEDCLVALGERMGDDEIEECLMKVVEIFNYVTDKDLFAEQYRCTTEEYPAEGSLPIAHHQLSSAFARTSVSCARSVEGM